MQRRTRSLVAIVAAILAGTALASCDSSGGGSAGKPRELRVLVSLNPQQQIAAQQAWFQRIQQKFKAQTGANLVFETYASSNEETTKIQDSAASGNGPDVYALGTTFVPVAYATGAFHVLTDADWAQVGTRQRFFPPQLVMSGPDEQHQIAIPMNMRPYGMVYNTAMFQAAGISTPPTSWDEFVADAQKLTNPSAGVYGTVIDYADGYNPWKYIWALTLQSGGRLVSDDKRTALLSSDKVAAATDAYFDLLTKRHLIDPKAAGWKGPDALAAFAAGKAAMMPMVNSGVVPTLEQSPVKGQYALAPNPVVPFGATNLPPGGVGVSTLVSGDDLAIASYTKNPDLALAYINLVTSPDEQTFYYQTFGDIPANVEAATEMARSYPQVASSLDAERAAAATPFTGAWADVQLGLTDVVTQSLPALATGHYDPNQVRQLLADENRKVQDSLDRQKH